MRAVDARVGAPPVAGDRPSVTTGGPRRDIAARERGPLAAQHRLRGALLRAIFLPLGVTLVLAAILVWQVSTLDRMTRWVEQTDNVIAQAHRVQRLLIDMETGLRGYLLTGDAEFLMPYDAAAPLVPQEVVALEQLTADDPAEQDRWRRIGARSDAWRRYAEEAIAPQGTGGEAVRLVQSKRGKQMMDEIRGLFDDAVSSAEILRRRRVQAAEARSGATLMTAGGLTLVLGVLLAFITRRQLLHVGAVYQGALDATDRARRDAEEASRRLDALLRVVEVALVELDFDALLHELLRRVAVVVPCDVAVILIREEGEPPRLQVRTTVGFEPDSAAPRTVPFGSGFVGRIAESRQALVIDDVGGREPSDPFVTQGGVRSVAGVPLVAGGRLIGVLHVGSRVPGAFGGETLGVLGLAADRIALALERATARTTEREARDALATAAEELERRVREQTARLADANAELEAYAYTIAHDLRAPLRAMEGFAGALLEDHAAALGRDGREYAERIATAAKHLDALITDLLDYSRLSREKIEPQPVALDDVVRDAVDGLGGAERGEVVVEAGMPRVRGNRVVLAHVLRNLLDNALKFVPAGAKPHVTVSSEVTDGRVRVFITDEGIGVSSEHRERIFRVFERLHGGERYAGTGIGLAIVKKGIERLGGHVGVETAESGGARFWFELERAV